MAPSVPSLVLFAASAATVALADPLYTFDGVTSQDPQFIACHDASSVLYPNSIDEMAQMVADAAASNTPVRASGHGHMWYDTMCSDRPTQIIKTDNVHAITDFSLEPGASSGTVTFEAGTTFFELAEYLSARNASMGYTLVNWNMTIAGAMATGSHRMSLSEPSMVSAGALAMDIINGKGEIVHLEKDESDDRWLAATVSLGLLGITARVQFQIYPEFKLSANQETFDEDEWLDMDYYELIAPYPTANFWWWPGQKKVHYRTYEVVPSDTEGEAMQTTFSVSQTEADIAKGILNGNNAVSNGAAESLFYTLWRAPNFVWNRDSTTGPLGWPVVGWSYDTLIGGLVKDKKTEWDAGLHGFTFEIACPLPHANALLKRARELMDEEKAAGRPVHSTYRSGVNIKFGSPFNSLLGQTVETDDADWSKGVLMLDWASFWPEKGDHQRYNEVFYDKLASTLIAEFPVRPHWTKNTREVFQLAVDNGRINEDHLDRFTAVREEFDPDNIFSSIVGEIFGINPATSA